MISRLNNHPSWAPQPRGLRAGLETASPPGSDLVTLGPAWQRPEKPGLPPPPAVPAERLAQTGSRTASRVLAVVGLAAVAMSLAGCKLDLGGGATPPAPGGQTQTQTQPAATSLAQRLEQLKPGDRGAYLNMAEASYYHRVLDRFAQETDPAARSVVELASRANQAWDFNGDPGQLRTQGRDVLQAIAQGQRADGVVGRYQDVARAALRVGEALSGPAGQAAAEGFVTTLKVNGYEQALTELLRRLPEAHAQLQASTGHDPALVRNYTEGLATLAQVGMQAGRELNDPALQAVVLETTVTELYGRIKEDGAVLGTQVKTALDLAMQLKQRFGG